MESHPPGMPAENLNQTQYDTTKLFPRYTVSICQITTGHGYISVLFELYFDCLPGKLITHSHNPTDINVFKSALTGDGH